MATSSPFDYCFPSIFPLEQTGDYISKLKLSFKYQKIVLQYDDCYVSKIIGNGGSNINQIRKVSGAKITIKDYGRARRRIDIVGNAYAIAIVKHEFDKCTLYKGWYDF